MSFFKDISNTLANKYPNRKVYVISDHHFDHRKILELTRKDLLEGCYDVEKMNDFIIQEHNKVVGEDDIVLLLGDFSFKRSQEQLSNFVSRLNGHKFLVLGNHDNTDRIDAYLRAGFEDVYLYPVQLNGDYYSHYPLNATAKSKERPNTVLYNLLCREFKDASSGVNYHGHQHELVKNGDCEKNVTCEQLSYKPYCVGRTKDKQQEEQPLPVINEEFFDVLHIIMSRYNHFKENCLITDYLYTIILELLTEYKDQIVVFGSYMLNKKYGSSVVPSDLDVTKLYDCSKSKKENLKEMKLLGNEIYEKINQVEGMHLDFFKKIDFICILSFLYASKEQSIKGFLDMNIILDDFYQSEDFIQKDGKSLLEYYTFKSGLEKPKTFRFPRFSAQTTNAFGDMTNAFLQYIYATDPEKKKKLTIKMERIMKNMDVSSQEEFETLENMMIRYLLRNIYFFETARRKKESDFILCNREIELPAFIRRSKTGEALREIITSREYNHILDTIANSHNRKEEISSILRQYKK